MAQTDENKRLLKIKALELLHMLSGGPNKPLQEVLKDADELVTWLDK